MNPSHSARNERTFFFYNKNFSTVQEVKSWLIDWKWTILCSDLKKIGFKDRTGCFNDSTGSWWRLFTSFTAPGCYLTFLFLRVCEHIYIFSLNLRLYTVRGVSERRNEDKRVREWNRCVQTDSITLSLALIRKWNPGDGGQFVFHELKGLPMHEEKAKMSICYLSVAASPLTERLQRKWGWRNVRDEGGWHMEEWTEREEKGGFKGKRKWRCRWL